METVGVMVVWEIVVMEMAWMGVVKLELMVQKGGVPTAGVTLYL